MYACIEVLENNVPEKQKYNRTNQAHFKDKKLNHSIM